MGTVRESQATEIGAPTGLFGLTRAIALVFSVKRDSQSSTFGWKPAGAKVIKGMASTPNISSVILLESHGSRKGPPTVEARSLVIKIPAT